MTEKKKASPELRIFFERLLKLKEKIKSYQERDEFLREIYEELDNIIKEAK